MLRPVTARDEVISSQLRLSSQNHMRQRSAMLQLCSRALKPLSLVEARYRAHEQGIAAYDSNFARQGDCSDRAARLPQCIPKHVDDALKAAHRAYKSLSKRSQLTIVCCQKMGRIVILQIKHTNGRTKQLKTAKQR